MQAAHHLKKSSGRKPKGPGSAVPGEYQQPRQNAGVSTPPPALQAQQAAGRGCSMGGAATAAPQLAYGPPLQLDSWSLPSGRALPPACWAVLASAAVYPRAVAEWLAAAGGGLVGVASPMAAAAARTMAAPPHPGGGRQREGPLQLRRRQRPFLWLQPEQSPPRLAHHPGGPGPRRLRACRLQCVKARAARARGPPAAPAAG